LLNSRLGVWRMNPPESKTSWIFTDLITDYPLANPILVGIHKSSFHVVSGQAYVVASYSLKDKDARPSALFPISVISEVGTSEQVGRGCYVVITLHSGLNFAFKVGNKTNLNRQKAARMSGEIKCAISENMGNAGISLKNATTASINPEYGAVNQVGVQQRKRTPPPPSTSTQLQPLNKKKGGFKGFWSGLPMIGKVALIGGVIILLVIVIVASISGSKQESNSTETSNTSTETSNTQFEQIGAYNPPGAFDAGLEADSYYVSNPTKSAIRKFCEQQKSERLSDLKNYDRHLVISFYDDWDHTPNYTDGYDATDTTYDQYRIADYIINPVGGGTDEVTFYKDIPE
jgi:hypothetical protein